ncbi:hypothetical protein FSP39_002129 [Pinctada imbricata]|uniref:Putative 2'-deoxynucleoside 5'-phosphate N-hydrolase 1 n=1 Tax=Pinctada imbricata TaxID=66713 RepID=A0AA88XV33_PINIB|nr:hypothetical protein FSP39_002129 [Pinctada imbricata]
MSKKIYFAGSIRGGRDDAELYLRIVTQLKDYGTVFTEHVASPTVEKDDGQLESKFIHDRDMDWLNQSDYLVAEVTQPSLGVGYEIGRAVDLNKKILCLFRPEGKRKLSCMIDGAVGPNFTVKYYTEEEVPGILKEFFST